MGLSSNNSNDAWRHFYQEYGEAMVAWQILESEIATLFSFLTKIPPAMAVKIYYAPRSFNGRVEVFKESISAALLSTEIRSFARTVLKKAKQYAEYRNKFAHDQPLLRQQGSPLEKNLRFDILLVDGKGQFQTDDAKQRYMQEGVSVGEITNAGACFRELSTIIHLFWASFRSQGAALAPHPAWLETLQERLHALPALPRKGGLFRPSEAPKSPPEPSRR